MVRTIVFLAALFGAISTADAQVSLNAGASVAVGPGVRTMTPAQRKQLNELLALRAEEVLAGVPTKPVHRGYIGEQRSHLPLPKGCIETSRHDPMTRQTFVRVSCNGAYR